MPKRRHQNPIEIKPKTSRQKELLDNLEEHDLVFALGSSGSGKTFIATQYACQLFDEGLIDKIIITRPMISAEENIGFLPGDVSEKFAPYFAPVRELLEENFGKGFLEQYIKSRQIEIRPIGFLRGHTFRNCFVLFDEAQNTTPEQMKLFLTRIGTDAQVCVTGDLRQCDIEGLSGLEDAIERTAHLDEVAVTRFQKDDCVRSGLARKILELYY